MSTAPIPTLQLRALEQRGRLHKTASDLRDNLRRTREKLRLSKQARDHLITVSLLAGFLGVLSGYGFAGMFTRHQTH
jgi:hypothetical protein